MGSRREPRTFLWLQMLQEEELTSRTTWQSPLMLTLTELEELVELASLEKQSPSLPRMIAIYSTISSKCCSLPLYRVVHTNSQIIQKPNRNLEPSFRRKEKMKKYSMCDHGLT